MGDLCVIRGARFRYDADAADTNAAKDAAMLSARFNSLSVSSTDKSRGFNKCFIRTSIKFYILNYSTLKLLNTQEEYLERRGNKWRCGIV